MSAVRRRLQVIRASLADIYLELAALEQLVAPERCECGAIAGENHTCTVLPRMDTPEMMGTEDPQREQEFHAVIKARGLRP